MAVERRPPGVSFIDVLDRVLDKGVVIEAWMGVSLGGIELVTVEARVVVASIETYLRYAADLTLAPPVARATSAPHRAAAAPSDDGRMPPAGDAEQTQR